MEELSLREKEALVSLTEPISLEEFMQKTKLKHVEAMTIIKFLLHSRYIHRMDGFPTKYCVERFLLKKVKLLQKRLDMTSLQSNACDAVIPMQSNANIQKQ